MSEISAFQRMQDSNRYKIQSEDVDIPISDTEVIEAKLISPDLFDLREELDDLKKKAYIELKQDGYGELPIDEDEWNAEIQGFKDSDEYKNLKKDERLKRLADLEDEKPKNLAEQQAPYKARLRVVKNILPRLLRDRETGAVLFPTTAEARGVSEMIGASPELMRILSQAYGRLNARILEQTAADEEVKN